VLQLHCPKQMKEGGSDALCCCWPTRAASWPIGGRLDRATQAGSARATSAANLTHMMNRPVVAEWQSSLYSHWLDWVFLSIEKWVSGTFGESGWTPPTRGSFAVVVSGSALTSERPGTLIKCALPTLNS
jgi:hypothetical protein